MYSTSPGKCHKSMNNQDYVCVCLLFFYDWQLHCQIGLSTFSELDIWNVNKDVAEHNHSYFKDNMVCCAANCADRPT